MVTNRLVLFLLFIYAKCIITFGQNLVETFDSWPIHERWGWEVENNKRITIDSKNSRNGKGSLRLELRPNDRASNGNRSEIKIGSPELNKEGNEVWVKYSIMIPENFVDTSYLENKHKITQWHDAPPPGFTWADYSGHEPSINLEYRFKNQESYFVLNYGNFYHRKDTFPDGSPIQKLNKQQTVATKRISKGRWYDLTYHIKWSQNDDGFIEVWLDDNPWTQNIENGSIRIYGANMYNLTPNYFKAGLYRPPVFSSTNFINIDEFAIGKTRDEVEAPSVSITRNDYLIAPTRNSGSFTVKFSKKLELVQMRIVSMAGDEINQWNKFHGTDQMYFDLSEKLTAGVYLIYTKARCVIDNKNYQFSDRIIVE